MLSCTKRHKSISSALKQDEEIEYMHQAKMQISRATSPCCLTLYKDTLGNGWLFSGALNRAQLFKTNDVVS